MKVFWARLFGLSTFCVLLFGFFYDNYELIKFFAVLSWGLSILGGISALFVLISCVIYDENENNESAVKAILSQESSIGLYGWLITFPMVIATTLMLALSEFSVTAAVYLSANILCMIAKYCGHERYKKIKE